MVAPHAAVEYPGDTEPVGHRAGSGAQERPAPQLLDLVCPTLELADEVVLGADPVGEGVGRLHELGSGPQALTPRVARCDGQGGSKRVSRADRKSTRLNSSHG